MVLLDEADMEGVDGQVPAVGGGGFAEQACDVALHSRFAHVQVDRDVGVGEWTCGNS